MEQTFELSTKWNAITLVRFTQLGGISFLYFQNYFSHWLLHSDQNMGRGRRWPHWIKRPCTSVSSAPHSPTSRDWCVPGGASLTRAGDSLPTAYTYKSIQPTNHQPGIERLWLGSTWSETYFRQDLFPAYLFFRRQFHAIMIFRLKSISDLDSRGSLPRFFGEIIYTKLKIVAS